MAVTRPSRYPIVAQTPGGNYAEPGSGVQLGGWQTGAIFPSADANWLFRQVTDWGRSLDASRLASTDILDAAKVMRVSSTALTITTGGGTTLTAEITAGGIYYGKGERLDLTDAATVYAGGNSLVFPASSTRYVIARPMPATGGAVSGSSTAELAVSASAAVAGWSTLMTVTTGVATITSAVQHADVVTTFNFGHACVFGQTVDFSAQATFGSFATFNDNTDFNDLSVWNISSGSSAVQVNQSGTGAALELLPTSSGPGLQADASGGTGYAGRFVGNGSAVALVVTGSLTGSYACTIAGTGQAGGAFIQGAGAGWGLAVNGGTSAGAYGIVAIAQNTTGNAIYATSHNNGTVAAIKGAGTNLAAGVEASASAFYPLLLSPDLTSPTYGHIFADPQNAAPTSAAAGSLAYVASTINAWGHGNASDGAYRWMWSSKGGYVYGASYNQTVTSTSAVSYSTLATVTLTSGSPNGPHVANESVVITASVRFRVNAAGATGVDMRVVDSISGTVFEHALTGTAITNGYYLPGATTDWGQCFTVEREWVLSSTATRTFTLEIRRWGATPVFGHGSLKIRGV